jgi:electron transfer flavoprotein alpha subunit
MNNDIKRIDPRRPFIVTSAGLKRITLGEIGNGVMQDFAHGGHKDAVKPRRTTKAAKKALLVAAHTDRGSLDDHSRQALAAAALLADDETEVVLIAFGEFKDDAAALGADRHLELPQFDRRNFAPDEEVRALTACVSAFAPVHIFMPDSATGDGDLGRRYAARADASIATQVVELDHAHVASYAHAGRAIASRELPDVVLLAVNAVEAKLPFVGAGNAITESIVPAGRTSAYVDLGIEEMDAAQVALEEADFIVSAGNGVSDIVAFEALASTLGAAIGASRVAVDDGKFTRDKQIGATGKTVEASVYIAFGISGAVQHLQGIKDCRHVIAVNLDASAPIAKRANLTIVADTHETIKALSDAAAAARAARANGSIVQNTTIVEGVAA